MSNFKGQYLRILTPQTTDGINLKYDQDNEVVLKETHLPMTARKSIEKRNAIRPKHLQHIIEEVGEPAPKAKVRPSAPVAEAESVAVVNEEVRKPAKTESKKKGKTKAPASAAEFE
jgi:hypothetical protein